jgi:DNA repair protein RecO (recombination protein O)
VSVYQDEGVVLRTIRLGEADRIVTVMTAEHGKVRAVAKGIRKTNSRLGARLEPATGVALLLWRGRELDIVRQAEVTEGRRELREDLGRLSKAYAMLEVVDHLAPERTPMPGVYRMLKGALGVLAEGSPPLLVPAFILRLLSHEGSAPVLEVCASCGASEDLVAFDLGEGGALCRECRRGRAVSKAALSLMHEALSGKLREVLDEPEGPLAEEVRSVTTEAIEWHLERRVRSLHSTIADVGAHRQLRVPGEWQDEPGTEVGTEAPGR